MRCAAAAAAADVHLYICTSVHAVHLHVRFGDVSLWVVDWTSLRLGTQCFSSAQKVGVHVLPCHTLLQTVPSFFVSRVPV